MRPETSAWVANIRAEAAQPGTLFVIVGGRVAIPPKDIVGKTDEQLLAFIAARFVEL